MKKFFLTLLFILLCSKAVFAQDVTPVDFIYINGSNTNNEKAYDNFVAGISRFHPVLKAAIEKDEFTNEHILKNGKYAMSETPSHYFWGYKSKEDLVTMHEKAKLLQSISPLFAYAFRNVFSDMMHDAIWVRNSNNMIPILSELHAQIKKDVDEGKKVVLLGYSAGTFITMEYLASRIAYIDLQKWLSRNSATKDLQNMMKQNPRKHSCASALFNSDMISLTPMGAVRINPHKDEFIKAYLNMDKLTDEYCLPDDSIVGVINYASPIPLFYSDISNPKYDVNKFFKLMYKYVIEHDTFLLTVNFADDPLGFPNDVNYKNSEISKYLDIDFAHEKGFFYDYSNDLSWRTVICAHTSYWNAKERFAKAIVKGYKKGYEYQYKVAQEEIKK